MHSHNVIAAQLFPRVRQDVVSAPADHIAEPDVAILDGGSVWIGKRYLDVFRRHGLDSLEALLTAHRRPEAKVMRTVDCRTNFTLRLTGPQGGETVYFGKVHNEPGQRGPGSGQIEWDNTLALRRAGVPTPHPAAMATDPSSGRSAIFTEKLPGAIQVDDYLASLRDGPPGAALRVPDLARRVGALVRRFHEAGFNHRDLYLSHLFICPDDPERLFLIDLQRVQRRRWRRYRWIVKDLAQLCYSWKPVATGPTDVARFLRAYTGEPRLTPATHRLARAAEAKARRMARRLGSA